MIHTKNQTQRYTTQQIYYHAIQGFRAAAATIDTFVRSHKEHIITFNKTNTETAEAIGYGQELLELLPLLHYAADKKSKEVYDNALEHLSQSFDDEITEIMAFTPGVFPEKELQENIMKLTDAYMTVTQQLSPTAKLTDRETGILTETRDLFSAIANKLTGNYGDPNGTQNQIKRR